MFRYRTTHQLLDGFHELENQEIYLSDLKSLNDPMEGFVNIYWEGDTIVWKNLIQQYLLSLFLVCEMAQSKKPQEPLENEDINVFANKEDFRDLPIYTKIKEILNCLNNELVHETVLYLSNRKISNVELDLILLTIHLELLYMIFQKNPFFLPASEKLLSQELLMDKKAKMIKSLRLNKNKPDDFNELRIVYDISLRAIKEILYSKFYCKDDPAKSSRLAFLFIEFPSNYSKRLENIMFHNTYVSCFSQDCNNESMWSHYSDSHKGVCLEFEVKETDGKKTIMLETVNGFVGTKGQEPEKTLKNVSFCFEKVTYSNKFESLNFFTNIGVLPKPRLLSQWYTDEKGKISSCAGHLSFESFEEWRISYWFALKKQLTTKTPSWAYEKEYRLIDIDFLGLRTSVKERKLKYDFNTLKSITFGLKTSQDDINRIKCIIEQKCKENNRKSFDFFLFKYSDYMNGYERIPFFCFKD